MDVVKVNIELIQPLESKSHDTLVLSGGGTAGIKILGSLQKLYECGKLEGIANYFGTSIGAAIILLLVIGYTPIECLSYICSNELMKKFVDVRFDINRLLGGQELASFEIVKRELIGMISSKSVSPDTTLKQLYTQTGKSLNIFAYNISDCILENFNHVTHPDLKCIDAVEMSCCVPLVFKKTLYIDKYYIDGGVVCNFPIEHARKISSRILGINIQKDVERLRIDNISTVKYILHLLNIYINQTTGYIPREGEDVIQIRYSDINFMDFNLDTKTLLNIFSSGYRLTSSYVHN